MNHLNLIGRLVKNPSITYKNSENPLCVANFVLAVPRRNNKEESDFFACVAFGKNGEFTEKYLKKGMKMAVHGHLRSSKVQNEDGSVAYYVNMVVDEFEFAQSKQESKKMANEENADLVEDYQNYDDFSFR